MEVKMDRHFVFFGIEEMHKAILPADKGLQTRLGMIMRNSSAANISSEENIQEHKFLGLKNLQRFWIFMIARAERFLSDWFRFENASIFTP